MLHDRLQTLAAYRPALVLHAKKKGLDAHTAEDCVQDVFLKAASDETLDLAEADSLLRTMVRNRAIDIMRSERSRDRRQLQVGRRYLASRTGDPSTEICDRAEAAWAAAQLHRLTKRERDLAELVLAGATVADAGRLLGMSPKNTSVTWSRASKAMRRMLELAGAAIAGAFGLRHRAITAPAWVAAAMIGSILLVPLVREQPAGSLPRLVPDAPLALAPSPKIDLEAARRSEAAPATRNAISSHHVRQPGPALTKRPIILVDELSLAGGLVRTDGPVTTETQAEEETFLETVERCVEQGVIVSVHYQGCAPSG